VSKARVRSSFISSQKTAALLQRARVYRPIIRARFSHGWHVARLIVWPDCGLHSRFMLRGESVAPSSQMAAITLAAVPLWKVNAGAPTPAN